ncbi:DUF4241 domain-containing protein [Nocardia tengchongensis]|uniref:DUF4241 domain-containing protein n=1 Tax=Nocardia tengchongensis TaxID=2055889 RepID=UPI00369B030A
MSAAAAEHRHAAGQSYAVLLSARHRPLALAECWSQRGEWRVYLFDDRSLRVQMVDLEPHSETSMRVSRDIRWLLTGDEIQSNAWATQTTVTISSNGYIEVETAFDWASWDARLSTLLMGAPGSELDTAIVEHFSYSGDYTAAELASRQRFVAFPSKQGHDHAPIVLALPTPQFGDWHVFVDLLAARGHKLAPTVTLYHDASADDCEPLSSNGIERLLTAGTTLDTIDGPVVIELEDAGTVRVPSGHLAASDPGWISGDLRTVLVPPGDYPVTLSLMRSPSGKTVGAAKVTVNDAPVSRWEMALCPGEDAALLGAGQFWGVDVDSGYIAFLDASHSPVDENPLSGAMSDALAANAAVELTTPNSGGLNIIAFKAGHGDGAYPLWIGRASDEQISCVVLDFGLATSP